MLVRKMILCFFLLASRLTAAEFPDEFEGVFLVSGSGEPGTEWHREKMVPTFKVISGAIFGGPREDLLLPITEGENSSLTAPLGEWTELLDTVAEPLTDEYVQLGLHVEPGSTKIARLGTFVHDGVHNLTIGGYLNELGKKSVLILIYVDRACTIRGAIEVGGTTYHHDIDIAAAGFHYLEADRSNHIREITPDGRVLFVTVH